MKSKNSVNFTRALTSLISKNNPVTEPLTSLKLDSYIQPSNKAIIYSYNKAIDHELKFGSLSSALKLFDEMPVRDVVTWNMLISGYGRSGLPGEAMCLYKQMVSEGISESSTTFSSALSICCNAGLYRQGVQIHSRVIVLGFSLNMYVVGALIDLYMRVGLCDIALRLFSGLDERSLGVWNIVLRGFAELGRSSELLRVFNNMKEEGVVPNALTICYLIRGCGCDKFFYGGKQLHCFVLKNGWFEFNIFVANALVDFYSECGLLDDADETFQVISPKDVISWNSMVSAYARNGLTLEALDLFSKMQFWDKKPSLGSFVGLVSLSSGKKNLLLGKQIHGFIIKLGFDAGNIYVQSALIDMYGKCGDIESSVSIFEGHGICLESGNSMMTSLMQSGLVEDVVGLFTVMLDKETGFDEVSLSTTLKALSMSSSASFVGCTMMHCRVIKSGFLTNFAVSCSLIDAYSKFGHVKLSHQLFEELPTLHVVCFTSIINAYGRNGMGMQGLEMLQEMIQKGLEPDKVTFLCVLNGCNHSGLVAEGKMVFDLMRNAYGINPDRKHYSCLVELFGRAGLLEDAEELLKQAPERDDSALWSSLLRSCRINKNESVGRRVAKILMDLEPEDVEVWLQASNFYSEIGEFETSMHVRELAIARRMRMDIGNCLIESRTHF